MDTLPVIKGIRGITARQLLAVDLWIRDRRRSMARALREAGYSEAIVHQPHKVFGAPAVKMELWRRGLGVRLAENAEKVAQQDFESWQKEKDEKQKKDAAVFSKMTPESLRELKRKLAELPEPFYPTPENEPGYPHTAHQFAEPNDPFALGEIAPPAPAYQDFSAM